MAEELSIVRRFIQRDEAMRRAGKEPYAASVRRTLDLILSHELLQDQTIRRWVVARASQPDYWIAVSTLKVARKLAERDLADDALQIFEGVISAVTEGNAAELGKHGYSHLRDLGELILHPGLVSKYPNTWGRRIIDLQAAALYGHQEGEWPQTLEFRRSWNETVGPVYDVTDTFSPDYDDHPDIWYYQYGRVDHDMRGVLSRAVERGLAEALQLSDASAFRVLAELLFDSRWALAFCEVLAALYDGIRKAEEAVPWHIDEAQRCISDPRCEALSGTANLRRLLRRLIKGAVDTRGREAVVDCIRSHAPNSAIRVNELADLEDWGLLGAPELTEIEDARSKEELFEPCDPREAPRSVVTWTGVGQPQRRLTDRWPHAEDHRSLEILESGQPPPSGANLTDVESWILPRIEALKVITERAEARSEEWFGVVAGWCEQLVEGLKRWVVLQRQAPNEKPEAQASEYFASLARHAPWWGCWADLCLECLQQDVPVHHHEGRADGLVWSSTDPIYAAISFLDELLAADQCPELDAQRQRLGQSVSAKWSTWPLFTRATVLVCLRPFHWGAIEPLRSLLTSVVEQEAHADVLERSILHLLRLGSADIPRILQRVWRRIDSISDPPKTARLIGEVVGDATIRHRGDGEASPDLEALANWCDQLRDEKDKLPSIRGSLINGVLWAAEQHLDNVQNLAAGHADAWLPLARWGAGEFLGIRMGAEGRANVITAVTCVLKMTWPDEERRRLYEELGGIIERVIREGEVGQFSMLHFELKEELGQRRYTERHGGTGRRTIAPSDELMVRLCRASAERVVGWRRAGETTQDLGYGACLWGGDTADLLEHVYEYARDRDFVRRELAPIIDILAGAGLTPMATDLRLKIRRA